MLCNERPGENIDSEPNPTEFVPGVNDAVNDAGHGPTVVSVETSHGPTDKAYQTSHGPTDIAHEAGHGPIEESDDAGYGPTDVYYTDLGTSTSTQVCWIQ